MHRVPTGEVRRGVRGAAAAWSISDAWTLEPDRAPWRRSDEELGFRSSAAVPLLDEAGKHDERRSRCTAAYPGYFSTNRVDKLLTHLREVLSHAAAQRLTAPVIPLPSVCITVKSARSPSQSRCIYQPIVDLRTGSLDRLEALARLQRHDGTIVAPNDFSTPWETPNSSRCSRAWCTRRAADWHLFAQPACRRASPINIPAQALGDMRYLDTICLRIWKNIGVPADRFVLEILETQGDGPDVARARRVHRGVAAQRHRDRTGRFRQRT